MTPLDPRTVDWGGRDAFADLGLRSTLSFTGVPCVGDEYTARGYTYRYVLYDDGAAVGKMVTLPTRRAFLWRPRPLNWRP